MERPKIGIGVIIIKDGKVLLGKRKNAHGAGSWSFPGGHLEVGESWEDCAMRETLEETGLTITDTIFVAATNDIFEKEDKHYITLFMQTTITEGEPQVMEVDKCEGWEWFDWNAFPEELFIPIQNLRSGRFNPFELENT